LKETTKVLGQQLRYWVKKTCSVFDTRELPKEETARHRRKASAVSKPKGGGSRKVQGKHIKGSKGKNKKGGPGGSKNSAKTQTTATKKPHSKTLEQHNSKLRKFFNMCTYKLHALGHYVAAIARFGSTDGYSTQIVSIPCCFANVFA